MIPHDRFDCLLDIGIVSGVAFGAMTWLPLVPLFLCVVFLTLAYVTDKRTVVVKRTRRPKVTT